jgi:hypothetical protein
MIFNKKIIMFIPLFVLIAGCTKLEEDLGSNLTASQAGSALGASGTDLLLKAAYVDLTGPFGYQDPIFALEENTSDEALVPTRGGDWDDNGVWRVLHAHTWNANHSIIGGGFNSLSKLNFDATNVLAFGPTLAQAAEAKFLRAFALYHLLSLYGQYPFRNPGDNLLNAPQVKAGKDATDFIISELTTILPNLKATNGITLANPDAAKVLLMKCYLNRGAFANRAAPTFDAADMQQVITLGNSIIASGKYTYSTKYFDNFAPNNGAISKEGIFAYPNQSGVNVNHLGIESRWKMTLHYNSYTPENPNAGWNGFSTISDFYSTFSPTGTVTFTPADSTLPDTRIGAKYYPGTEKSGIKPGFLAGQQYNENGVKEKDRKGNDLAFTSTIAANQIETGNNLEITGIRVVKYVPDYANFGGPAGNWLMFYRYPDVVLMVAEAKLRTGDAAGALVLVNQLRAARGATPMTSIPLVNPANVEDPNTLLAERGREFYWEMQRRTDLIRFGMFLKPWQYKPVDDPKYLVFPLPSSALAANPNLKQNPGY